MGVTSFQSMAPTPRFTDADLLKADYSQMLAVIGNGDAYHGLAIFQAIVMRLLEARAKHPRWEDAAEYGLKVVGDEFVELAKAVYGESERRQMDEALDVIVTAIRFYGKEWEQ